MGFDLAIVLCTYNGRRFLQEQLDSFSKQTFKSWSLFVYDDGSTDNTKTLIDNFREKTKEKINFTSNSQNFGYAKNFLNGIDSTPESFDFYALSDQDDIWLKSKLERAVNFLKEIESHVPALYCSRTTLTDSVGNVTGSSPLFCKEPSFNNALIQSIAGGNTMVFNKAARRLISKAEKNLDVVSHDWFIYQLVTGAGGKVYYDQHSEILYRQHDSNLVGANNSLIARLSRLKMLLNASFRAWNDKNINALQKNSKLLTKENKNKLDGFVKFRDSSLIPRVTGFINSGLYRQTFFGNVALFVGGILNKV